tara:strand:- start:152 stop:538 length:387 start_codon:yes stop_codon:yes gene_type:complete
MTQPYENTTTYLRVLSRRFAVSLHQHDGFPHAIITEYTTDPAGRTNDIGAMLASDCTHTETTHTHVVSYPENLWQLGMLCIGELVFCDDRLEDMATDQDIESVIRFNTLMHTMNLVKAGTTKHAQGTV